MVKVSPTFLCQRSACSRLITMPVRSCWTTSHVAGLMHQSGKTLHHVGIGHDDKDAVFGLLHIAGNEGWRR